jgi:tetratricopeptide (TPR) repeat protein
LGLYYNQGLMLAARFERGGHARDLEDAILCFERCLQWGPRLDYVLLLAAESLLRRYSLFGHLGDLRKAGLHLLKALKSKGPRNVPKARLATTLSSVLNEYHKRLERRRRLDLAIELSANAIAEAEGRDGLVLALNNRGLCLETRHLATGSIQDLDQAIADLRRAVELGAGTPQGVIAIGNLGNAVRNRYALRGVTADLEFAWRRTQEALSLTSPGGDGELVLLNNFAGLALDLYRREGKEDWIDSAVAALRKALDKGSDKDRQRARLWANLGACLLERSHRTESALDEGEGIEALTKAIALAPSGQDRVDALTNLAMAKQAARSAEASDPDSIVAAAQHAADAASPGSASQGRALGIVAQAVAARYERLGEAADADRASASFDQSVAIAEHVIPDEALVIAQAWISFELRRGRKAEAAVTAHRALAILSRLEASQIDLAGKAGVLRTVQGLLVLAAVAFASAQEVQSAVLALEAHRARLLTERLNLRSFEVERLVSMGRADLADRYKAAFAEAMVQDRVERITQLVNDTRPGGPPLLRAGLWMLSTTGYHDQFALDLAEDFEEKRRGIHRQARRLRRRDPRVAGL